MARRASPLWLSLFGGRDTQGTASHKLAAASRGEETETTRNKEKWIKSKSCFSWWIQEGRKIF
jgi:hypothetical protein